jgi:hypothetical protein
MNNQITQIFNGALCAATVAALDELNMFEELRARPIDVASFCQRSDLHLPSVLVMLQGLHKAGVLVLDEPRGVVRPGALFAEAIANKGYFRWLIHGYGEMLVNMAGFARNCNRYGNFIQRNGHAIACAARDYGAQFVDNDFQRVLGREPFAVVADLGCGDAGRLMNLARSIPHLRGIGLELDSGVVERANAEVARENLSERLRVMQSDVKGLQAKAEYAEVEVLFSFFMGHDLWPRSKCLEALGGICDAFPSARRFLLADTYRSELQSGQKFPIFTHGFEMTHALMGQVIPTITEWLEMFEESAWVCVEHYSLGIPFSCVFDLRRRW